MSNSVPNCSALVMVSTYYWNIKLFLHCKIQRGGDRFKLSQGSCLGFQVIFSMYLPGCCVDGVDVDDGHLLVEDLGPAFHQFAGLAVEAGALEEET